MAIVAILGDGSWGTAIALHLAQNPNHRIRLWSARSENARKLQQERENKRFLPGIRIPQNILLTDNELEAIDSAEVWVSAIPTTYLRSTISRFQNKGKTSPIVVSLTKGIEIETFRRPSEIIQEVLHTDHIGVLSGPSHAEEVCKGKPCSLVMASEDMILARELQEMFNTDRFRVYTNPDAIGVELAGALKNVIGIAAGICDGLKFGDNAKSALLTRGLVEIARFGMAFGAEHSTFYGLAGIGDLITTSFSLFGRNRRVGERLGQGDPLNKIISDSPMIAEGITTSRSVYERTHSMGLEMPIMTGVYQVLYQGKSPLEAVQELMSRRLKKE